MGEDATHELKCHGEVCMLQNRAVCAAEDVLVVGSAILPYLGDVWVQPDLEALVAPSRRKFHQSFSVRPLHSLHYAFKVGAKVRQPLQGGRAGFLETNKLCLRQQIYF